jgi:hypothetical protein
LAIYAHPQGFNFGVKRISAADKQKTTVKMTQKNWFAKGNPKDGSDSTDPLYAHSETYQSLRVYDGRVINDGWEVTVSATTFNNGTKDLKGASIFIAGATSHTTDTAAGADVEGQTNFEIKADGKTDLTVLKSKTSARFYSDIKWDTDKVTLEFPGANIDTGDFASTVTWTLTGTPDA